MKRFATVLLGSMVALSALAAGGCADDQTKQQLLDANKELGRLRTENASLKDRLKDADATMAHLQTSNQEKDIELNDLRNKLRAGVTKPVTVTPTTAPASPTATGWTATAGGDKITVGSDVLFDPGKDVLTAAGKSALAKIAKDLNSTYTKLPVRIYGHTDSDPIQKSKKDWEDNWELSSGRALEVTRYLVEQGVDPKRIEAVAMGEYHPEVAGKTPEAKKKNRRVEIMVVK